MNHSAELESPFRSTISKINMFMLLLFCLVASTGTEAWSQQPGDMPFACNPSLYMSQGVVSGSGPYNRTMVELDPSNLSGASTIIGDTANAINPTTGNPIAGPISINGIAHSFNDGAIYAISEHNSNEHQQGQHIYRIFRDSTGAAIHLYDLGKPVTSTSAPNQLAGMYTGGTMVLWDQLNSGLIGTPPPPIPHTPNNMESLMVVSTMRQGNGSPSLWTWHNHLFILAVEGSHIGNGSPRIIAGPIYVQDSDGNELSGLYDIAYNPKDNMIYGHNSDNPGEIVQIDLSNASTTLTNLTGGKWEVKATLLDLQTSPTPPDISKVGAAFFNGTDELLLYGRHSASETDQNQLFSATPLTSGSVALSTLGVSTGPFGASDGTSCAYSPRFTKTVSPSYTIPGGTATYTYTITNNQYTDFTVDFSDNSFDSNLTIMSMDVTGLNSSSSSYTGTPPSVTIDNIVVPANSSVTFTVTVQADSSLVSTSGQQEILTVYNQATLTAVSGGGFPTGTLLSDWPGEPGFEDKTPLDIVLCPSSCEPAKLNIKKTHSPATFTNGGTGTITVTVSNTGTDPVIAPIQVNDTLPAGLTMPPGPFSPAADIACLAGPQLPPPQQINCSYMGNSGGNFSFDLSVNVATDVDKVCNHAAVIKGCCGEKPNDETRDCISITNQKRGQICGQKFMDKGTKHPLAGWHINIKDVSGNIVGTATTNAKGGYCISVNPGTYKVSELPIPTVNNGTWIPMSPSTGFYPGVSVGSGVVTGIDFHNLKKAYGPVGSDNNPAGMLAPITKTHSPHTFSTGSKGTFSIKVKNKGKTLAKGMLKVVDHIPAGLSVRTGAFRAGSWTCKGGMVSSSGQDVTCTYNRKLGKHGRATLRLNARVAPKGRFPAGVDSVESCATASVRGAADVVTAGPKACDKVKIRRVSETKNILRNLAPLGGLIMQMPHGGGGGAAAPVRKTPGAVR